MQPNNLSTIDIISGIFCKSTKRVLELSTQKTIKFSTTIQRISKVSLRPEIGSFVQFTGDYNGLAVMNFTSGAAMELYRSYMIAMGLPESDLAKEYTSSEVPDSIGEMTNQIMGQSLSMIEEKYDLTAYCGQPKALALNSAITLTIDSDYTENRRISFNIESHRFYLELSMEPIEFISIRREKQPAS
ncbi:MAG: DUF3334 family protein [Desulfobacterales bacterium]|nr:DUF3334 family protein [Desulfobacterales bacterium]MBF0397143.1 DUF3334 family protein [Desulfobacterales bacterium]